jgi:glycolate oxidase FAD binding subunit
MVEQDLTEELRERIAHACAAKTPVAIRGGNSKPFYGHPGKGELVEVSQHAGVLEYEPSELVIHARAGTPLTDIEGLLEQHRQMLAFEPPRFSSQGTLGGTVAAGLAGPRRPFSGAVRDSVLGVGLINGRGELLHFGGRVMKNVAGYDVSRLMAGALGTLGLMTDVSLKVLPSPGSEYTVTQVCSQQEALERFSAWMATPLPLSAACWFDDHLYLRLSGTETGVRQAQRRLGDQVLERAPAWWTSIRDQSHEFFQRRLPLWRLSLPAATPPLAVDGEWLIDWGGGQRWLSTGESAETVRRMTASVGGHATLFRNGDATTDVFHPLPSPLLQLHRRLKQSFDPDGILNPGRMYRGL